MDFIVSNLFGRIGELNFLLRHKPPASRLVLDGNLFDYGDADAFRAVTRLIGGGAVVRRGLHDDALLCAAGAASWPSWSKKRWVNPYLGFPRTLSRFLPDWYAFMAGRETTSPALRDALEASCPGLLATLAGAERGCLTGDVRLPLTADLIDGDRQVTFQHPNLRDYYQDNVDWWHAQVNQYIYQALDRE